MFNSSANRFSSRSIVSAALSWLPMMMMGGGIAHAQVSNPAFEIERIISGDTMIPGRPPSNSVIAIQRDGNDYVFAGTDFDAQTNTDGFGIYRKTASGIQTLLTDQTLVPGTNRTFDFVDSVATFGGEVYFGGRDGFNSVIGRIDATGQVSLVPGATSGGQIRRLSVDAEGVTYVPSGITVSNPGVFRVDNNGVQTVIANTNTPVPGGTGTFTSPFGANEPFDVALNANGAAVFVAQDESATTGIYSDRSGMLASVVTTLDTFPGTNESFIGFVAPRLNGDRVTFFTATDSASDNRIGLYEIDAAGQLTTIVNNASELSPGIEFANFDTRLYDVNGDATLFQAITDIDSDLALHYGNGQSFGELLRVGGTLDGQVINFLGIPTATMVANDFIIPIRFDGNGSVARYRITIANAVAIPEPGGVAILVLGSLAVVFRTRRRSVR